MFSCKYHTTPHLSSKNNTLICDKRHCYTQKQSRQNISMLYLLSYYFPSKTSWKVILDISSAKTFCTLYSLRWTLHMPLFLHNSGFSIHLFIAILPSIVSITSLRVISDGFLFKTYPPFTPLYDLIIPAWTIFRKIFKVNLYGISFFSAIAFSKAHWGVWSYLHKRSLYANGVTFHKGLNYGEDVFLTTQLVYFSSRISVLKSKPLLHYIIRESSITNSRFNEKKARDILLYPSLVNDFLKDKPEYGSLQKELGAIRIQANNTLLSKRWFKDARTLSRESHAILKQYPDLKRIPQIKAFHKLFTLYARSGLLGRLYAQYYICKKKIK